MRIAQRGTSYVTQASISVEKENQKLGAKTKLLALGLTNAEINALLGV